MELKVLGSSSKGNCYVIQDDEEALILEAGVSLTKVKVALGFNVKKVAGCLITHSHGDHSQYSKDFECVFPMYANFDVIEKKKLSRTKELFDGYALMVGNFKVYPFGGSHDVPVLGFLISHPKLGNLVFITDSFMCEYKFPKLNHIMIECNYTDDAIRRAIDIGKTNKYVAERVMTSHMELQTCTNWLVKQDLDNVYNILLLHLSENNSDENEMYQVISEATGKPIAIAKTGLQLPMNNRPF